MPFDGTVPPPRRKPPSRATRSGSAFLILTFVVASCLFLAPVVIGTLVYGH